LKPFEVSFSPVDNERLANLCGVLDENLKQIETALDVSIARRGENFSVSGSSGQTRLAAEALQRFYEQANRNLSLEEIQLGLIEVAGGPNPLAADEALILHTRRRDLHGRTPRQVQYIRQIKENDITFGIGPAGTGKTYLAVACAVDAFERDSVKRIVLVRPAVEAGERLGFLPGDMAQKVDPYLRPLYDALYDLMGFEKVGKLFERGSIESLFHHSRRSSEHHPRADEDVPHPHGIWQQGGGQRRRHPDRPAKGTQKRTDRGATDTRRSARHRLHPVPQRRRGAPPVGAAHRPRL
jgi:phosphate starvation-inducible PhoH-like protein